MHDTAMEIGSLVMDRYSDLPHARILELGSLDVNGSLRRHAPASTEYIGIDLEAGPGVDIVVKPAEPLPVDDDSFDLVLASSVFEHDPMFWQTFLEMVRKTKNGGFLYVSAPSNGSVHRYPEDHWRFYPDSGLALERWAVSQGFKVRLVESFTAGRKGDEWNDFVAVFRKDGGDRKLPTNFVYEAVTAFNVLTWQTKEPLNPSSKTEDMLLIDVAREQMSEATHKFDLKTAENQINYDQRVEAERALQSAEGRLKQAIAAQEISHSQLTGLKSEVALHVGALARAERDHAETRDRLAAVSVQSDDFEQTISAQADELENAAARAIERDNALRQSEEAKLQLASQLAELEIERGTLVSGIDELRGRLASLESNLVQRQEEIEQTRAEVAALKEAHDSALSANVELGVRLEDSDRWVFRLAGERRQSEGNLRQAHAELAELEKTVSNLRARNVQLQSSDSERVAQKAELEELHERLRQSERDGEAANKTLAKSRLEKSGLVRERDKALIEAARSSHEASVRWSELASLTALLKHAQEASLATPKAPAPVLEQQSAESVQQQISQHRSDIERLGKTLENSQHVSEMRQQRLDWFRDVTRALQSQPWWWAFLSKASRRQRQLRKLVRLGLFDGNAYLVRNPDVYGDGMDPLNHYILHGMAENRQI